MGKRGELSGWLKVVIFGGTLLSITWLVMWLAAAAR
jgi:hypothetical protein